MKSVIFFAIGSVVLIATIGGLLLFSYMSQSDASPSEFASDPFSSADPFSSTGADIPRKPTEAAIQNEVVVSKTTKDIFAKVIATETAEMGSEGAYYRLLPQGSAATSSPFVVLVSPEQQYVQITIYGTPVGRYRKEAEKFLLNYFDISEAEACTMPYEVVPAYDTDTGYTDMNVGLSFCPGSIMLSEI